MSIIDTKINSVSKLQLELQELVTSLPSSAEFEELAKNTEHNKTISEKFDSISAKLNSADSEITSLLTDLNTLSTEFDSYER